MLASYIGTFDFPSMFVVIAIVAGITALGAFSLMRKRPRDYQADAKKMEFEHAEKMGTIVRDGDIARAKLQQNLITSHREES